MISFTCDYNEGAHPLILQRLVDTNMMQEAGYGDDQYTKSAINKIKKAIDCTEADVMLMVGGTQTNSTIIDATLSHHEAVIATDTGHIAVHEAGAVELFGHKVITLPSHEGKMHYNELKNYLENFYSDPTWQHMAIPAMVYVSYPTEYGTIYSRRELDSIYRLCQEYQMKFFIDGARLGYGLASEQADIDIKQLAQRCDVFYIGGTKIGALCGEAVVFPKGNAPKNFFTIVKQHGALLAKGRLLGIQFDTLFTDNLYLDISKHAIEAAKELRKVFLQNNIPLYIDSPTNQQFPILSQKEMEKLQGEVEYEVWETLPDGRAITRFATSWTTPMEHIQTISHLLQVPTL